MFDDDFLIVAKSWTWSATWDNLWLPNNEHAMPLGRLTTAMLVEIGGGRPTAMPRLTALQGPLAVVLAMVLAAVFVTREMGHAFYGLVVMILFGLSQKYNEAVFWYAASFMVLALDTTLLALLAAQRWRRMGRTRDLVLCAVWCGLAPAWFASGVLAGPLCALYLLPLRYSQTPGERGALAPCSGVEQGANAPRSPSDHLQLREWLYTLIPLFGTIVFVALGLTFAAHKVVRAEHHAGRSILDVFSPLQGLVLSLRSLVDNLIFGIFFATGDVAPNALLFTALAVLAVGGWLWWRVAPQRRLMLLGLGFVFFSYVLVYSFRAEGWSYDQQMVAWTRYNLYPYLGLWLFVCGGLPSREGSLFQLDPSGGLTRDQFVGLTLLTVVLVAVQLPLAIRGHNLQDPAPQIAILQHIETVDTRCREHRIDAATARAALIGPLIVPHSGTPPVIDGWELLRGSDNPRPMTPEEARRLLRPE
jgi:hypothetical protein